MKMIAMVEILEREEIQRLILTHLKLPVKRLERPFYRSMDRNLMRIITVGFLEDMSKIIFPPPQQPSSMRLKLRP